MTPETMTPEQKAEWIEKQRERLRAELDRSAVPEHLRAGLLRWMVDGIVPGSFLSHTLQGDSAGALLRADPASAAGMPALLDWLYNYAPINCWGSAARFTSWTGIRLDDD